MRDFSRIGMPKIQPLDLSSFELPEIEPDASREEMIQYFMNYHKAQADITDSNAKIARSRHRVVVIVSSLIFLSSLVFGSVNIYKLNQSERMTKIEAKQNVLQKKIDKLFSLQP